MDNILRILEALEDDHIEPADAGAAGPGMDRVRPMGHGGNALSNWRLIVAALLVLAGMVVGLWIGQHIGPWTL